MSSDSSIECPPADMSEWKTMVQRIKGIDRIVRIALVGKYVALHDAYLSVAEALFHSGVAANANVEIDWVQSEDVTEGNVRELLKDADGILVPGGFGDRGIEGKVLATKYAREHGVPFFGICLGMQMAVVEFARHVVGMKDAHSSEINEFTEYPVIDLMPDQYEIEDKGGTMRLGQYRCMLLANSKAAVAYRQSEVSERHRHRYEFNNRFRERMEASGMLISGTSPDGRLVEIIELVNHPWFVGVQFHPEFTSRPNRPQPLFREFVTAALTFANGGRKY